MLPISGMIWLSLLAVPLVWVAVLSFLPTRLAANSQNLAWRGSLLVWLLTGSLAVAGAVGSGWRITSAREPTAVQTSFEISSEVWNGISRLLPMVDDARHGSNADEGTGRVTLLRISPARLFLLAILCGVGCVLLQRVSSAAMGVSMGLVGLVLLTVSGPLILLMAGAHLVTIAVVLCHFPHRETMASIPQVLVSLQRWLLHQLPGDLLLLVAAVLLVSGLSIHGFEDLESLKMALPGTYQYGVLETGMLCWFLGCLPKLFLFPSMLSAVAIAELSEEDNSTKQAGLAQSRLALALAVFSAGAGILLLERSWPLLVHASLAGPSSGRELASQISSISAALCGWMFLSRRVLASASEEGANQDVENLASVSDRRNAGRNEAAVAASTRKNGPDLHGLSLLLATVLSLAVYQYFQIASQGASSALAGIFNPEVFGRERWYQWSWWAGWALGVWWLTVPVGHRRIWMLGGLAGLALLPVDLEGVKRWQQAAILLGILFVAMGVTWPSRREPEQASRSAGWGLAFAGLCLMVVYLIVAMPGQVLIPFIRSGQFLWRAESASIAGVVLAGGCLSALLGRIEALRMFAWRLFGPLAKPFLELGRDDLLVEQLFFWGIHLPVRGVAQLVRLGDWMVIDGCWQRVGSLSMQTGLWLRGLHTGQISFYVTTLVLITGLWLLLFVRS